MKHDEQNIKHAEITEKVIGIFYEVYNELGFGFLESIYEEAMALVLKQHGIEFQRQARVAVWFRGHKLGSYEADFLVAGVVMVELKAIKALESSHEVQLLHYLRSTEVEVGLLLNFGPKPQVRRFAFENSRKGICVHQRLSAANNS